MWESVKSIAKQWGLTAVLVLAAAVAAYLTGSNLKAKELKTCQTEQTALLKAQSTLLQQSKEEQRQADEIFYAGRESELKTQIRQKDEQLLKINEAAERDSIKYLTTIQSLRAIINYHKAGRTDKPG